MNKATCGDLRVVSRLIFQINERGLEWSQEKTKTTPKSEKERKKWEKTRAKLCAKYAKAGVVVAQKKNTGSGGGIISRIFRAP